MLEHVKAVLFDLDGTLVDSMWMWGTIDVEYLERHGFDLPENLQKTIEGMSFSETAAYFKERFGLKDSLEAIKAEWVEMAKDKYAREVFPKPGAIRFLEHLKKEGIRAGIATSNSRELLNAVMDSLKLWPYFGCCMTACEAGAGKPAPDIYRKVAKKLKVPFGECLVFEDTPMGIRAGKNAGMRVCAVEEPHCADQLELIGSLADYYINSFDQVLDGTYRRLR